MPDQLRSILLFSTTSAESYHLYPFTRSKNYLGSDLDFDLDRDPDDVPVYTGHSFCNTTKCTTLLFIVQSLLHRYLPNIWIKVI